MPRSSITTKGQTTIPKEIRDHLGLKPGDRIEFSIGPEGGVQIEAATVDLRSLKGSLSAFVSRPITLQEMKDAIRKRAVG